MLDIAIIPKIPRVGDIIAGQYVLGEEIGRGSMGIVFGARQVGLERRVAIKMLLPKALVIDGVVERFQRGARLASSLTHPHAVIIHAIGVHNDPAGGFLPFMAMEYLDGEDLYDYIERKGRLTVEESVWILQQALGSLAEAHSKSIIHRDLKPENLFVSLRDDGQRLVKVLDFGLAKAVMEGWDDRSRRLTATGMTCGTPEYMAPEQAVGEAVITPALDIYGLGCILYHMLSGEPPFKGNSPMTIALKHVTEPPPPLPPEYRGSFIEAIVQRTLSKRPEVRFQDAAALSQALESALGGIDPRTTPGWPSDRALNLGYRINEEEAELLERLQEENLPEWAVGTLQMSLVEVPQTTAPFAIPEEAMDAGTTEIRPISELLQQYAPHGSDEHDVEELATFKTNVSPEMLQKTQPPYRSMGFQPGSVSVNHPDAVTIDTHPNQGVDYSQVESMKTLITPGPKVRSSPSAPTPQAPQATAPVSLMPGPDAAAEAQRKEKAKQAKVKAARGDKRSSTGLWLMVALAILLAVAGLSVLVLSIAPHLTPNGGGDKGKAGAAAKVTISFSSEPAGASVYEGKELLGKTPFVKSFERAERTIRVRIDKSGFKDKTMRISLTEDDAIEIDLEKASDWSE